RERRGPMTEGSDPERTSSTTTPQATERTSSTTTPQATEPPGPPSDPPASAPATARPTGRVQSIDSAVKRILEFESNSVLVATIVLAVVIGVAHPGFLHWTEIKNVLQQSVYIGILAAGMAFLISMREIDLSVGSMFGLTVIASGLLMSHGMNPWIAAVIGIG